MPSDTRLSRPALEGTGSCPACRSTSITTKSVSRDENAYWRCLTCGEVWNNGRRQAPRTVQPAWR